MKRSWILSVVFLCIIVLPCCAGQVTLITPQKEFYFLTGEEAALPLTLNNSCDHDITGVLRFSTVAEKEGGNATMTLQEKTFTLFTGTRLYLLPAGRAATPRVLRGDIIFLYPDNGGRRASLENIIIHFVNTTEEIRADRDLQESTDMPDKAAGSAGMSVSGSTAPSADPLQKVQNNQPGQDIAGLQQQLQQEDAASLRQKKAFLALLLQDPVIAQINGSLVQDGFSPGGTEVFLDTDISGNFSLSYEKQARPAVVRGSVGNGSLLSADESSQSPVPLPVPLSENGTFRLFERELAENGFARNTTLMYYTPGVVTVNLTYTDAGNHITILKAVIVNGTITGIDRETPDQFSALLAPFLSVVLVCLLFAGILYLGRRLPRSPSPEPEKPGPGENRPGYRTIAEMMLIEAGVLAKSGFRADAYARAGRALRFILSHRLGDGRELTNEETLRMLSSGGTGNDRAAEILGRCSTVAFAKGTPDPEEFAGILIFTRDLLASEEMREKIRE